jgi:membrane-associated phospholipid phosphatase
VSVFVLYAIVNLAIPQWRPGAMEISGAHALIPHPTDNSFPSGHALFTGALLIGALRYMCRGWIITSLVILGCITLIARVIGGVHYPGDII